MILFHKKLTFTLSLGIKH